MYLNNPLIIAGLLAVLSCKEASVKKSPENFAETSYSSQPASGATIDGVQYMSGAPLSVSENKEIVLELFDDVGSRLNGFVSIVSVSVDGVSLRTCEGQIKCLQAGIEAVSKSPLKIVINTRGFTKSLVVVLSSGGKTFPVEIRKTTAPTIVVPPVVSPEPPQEGGNFVFLSRSSLTPASSQDAVVYFSMQSDKPVKFINTCIYNALMIDDRGEQAMRELPESARRCAGVSVEGIEDPEAGAIPGFFKKWIISIPTEGYRQFETFGVMPAINKNDVVLETGAFLDGNVLSTDAAYQMNTCDEPFSPDNMQRTTKSVPGSFSRFHSDSWYSGSVGRADAGIIASSQVFCFDTLCTPPVSAYLNEFQTLDSMQGAQRSAQQEAVDTAKTHASFCFRRPDAKFGDVVGLDHTSTPRKIKGYAVSPQHGTWAQNIGACAELNRVGFAKDVVGNNARWGLISYHDDNNLTTQSRELGKKLIGDRLGSLAFLLESYAKNDAAPASHKRYEFFLAGPDASSRLTQTVSFAHVANDDYIDSYAESVYTPNLLSPVVNGSGQTLVTANRRVFDGYELGDLTMSSWISVKEKFAYSNMLCVAFENGVGGDVLLGSIEPAHVSAARGESIGLSVTAERGPLPPVNSLEFYANDPNCSAPSSIVMPISDEQTASKMLTVRFVPSAAETAYYVKHVGGDQCKYLTTVHMFEPCSGYLPAGSDRDYCVARRLGYETSTPEEYLYSGGVRLGVSRDVVYSKNVMSYDEAVNFCWNSKAMGATDWMLQGGFKSSDFLSLKTGDLKPGHEDRAFSVVLPVFMTRFIGSVPGILPLAQVRDGAEYTGISSTHMAQRVPDDNSQTVWLLQRKEPREIQDGTGKKSLIAEQSVNIDGSFSPPVERLLCDGNINRSCGGGAAGQMLISDKANRSYAGIRDGGSSRARLYEKNGADQDFAIGPIYTSTGVVSHWTLGGDNKVYFKDGDRVLFIQPSAAPGQATTIVDTNIVSRCDSPFAVDASSRVFFAFGRCSVSTSESSSYEQTPVYVDTDGTIKRYGTNVFSSGSNYAFDIVHKAGGVYFAATIHPEDGGNPVSGLYKTIDGNSDFDAEPVVLAPTQPETSYVFPVTSKNSQTAVKIMVSENFGPLNFVGMMLNAFSTNDYMSEGIVNVFIWENYPISTSPIIQRNSRGYNPISGVHGAVSGYGFSIRDMGQIRYTAETYAPIADSYKDELVWFSVSHEARQEIEANGMSVPHYSAPLLLNVNRLPAGHLVPRSYFKKNDETPKRAVCVRDKSRTTSGRSITPVKAIDPSLYWE